MSLPRFWMPFIAPGLHPLPEHEAHHAARVRRLSAGRQVILFDGQGAQADGRIAEVVRGSVIVAVERIVHLPRPRPALTLASCLPKGPRQDLMIEKCTELGCAGLVPLVTRRSVAVASSQRIAGWQRTAVEAAKQSGQCWVPMFSAPRTLGQMLQDPPVCERLLVAMGAAEAAQANTMPKNWAQIAELIAKDDAVLAFVGPEGGWEPEEAAQLLAAGAVPFTLGPNVLRIETAAVALAALVHMLHPAGYNLQHE